MRPWNVGFSLSIPLIHLSGVLYNNLGKRVSLYKAIDLEYF